MIEMNSSNNISDEKLESDRAMGVKRRKTKKTIAATIFVLASVAFCVAITRFLTENNDDVSSTDNEVTASIKSSQVLITENGFFPQTISIEKDGIIEWKNDDVIPRRFKSDNEVPVDENLLPLESIPPQGSFITDYDQTGTYTFSTVINDKTSQIVIIVNEKGAQQ